MEMDVFADLLKEAPGLAVLSILGIRFMKMQSEATDRMSKAIDQLSSRLEKAVDSLSSRIERMDDLVERVLKDKD